ncbi:glycosyltransferase [Marinitoga litoralis]|uniref:glycosyltransferase n=1 Tax=Marinitoga litoralis TaxID=570855 RepID=UPI0019606392|nr:glycosyltransferase [Marinitoga litoralis]MBM7560337.1 glycosyltransferase involved in cell wall biosynthesis [Marinitoga litoralis]
MKKKVLHVITKGDWAGAQKVLYEIVKGIKEDYYNEFNVEVAVGTEGYLVEELNKIGITVYVLKHLKWNLSPFEDIKGIFELKKLIKNNNYDIVHLHSSKAGFIGRIAARISGVKNIIYTVHGWWGVERFRGFKKWIFLNVERFGAKFCNYIVLINKKDMKYASNNKIGNKKQYKLIYNNISILSIKKGILRNKLKISENIKIIGNVGRLDSPKNPYRFLKIAKKIIEKNKNFVFVWIGDGTLKNEIERKINNNDNILFLGFIKEPYEYIKDFDLLLMTSDFEGTPLTIIEALKLGIPILSTDVGGISEIIGKENTFDPDDIDAAVQKILNWEIASNNVYQYENMVEKYIELYRM